MPRFRWNHLPSVLALLQRIRLCLYGDSVVQDISSAWAGQNPLLARYRSREGEHPALLSPMAEPENPSWPGVRRLLSLAPLERSLPRRARLSSTPLPAYPSAAQHV